MLTSSPGCCDRGKVVNEAFAVFAELILLPTGILVISPVEIVDAASIALLGQ
jgi:hypothetical protein